MRLPPRLLPYAISAAMAVAATAFGAAKRQGTSINEAALFYHQGRYDSALARLESVGFQGPFKRRDSLSLYQYQGMASARLGLDSQATGYFIALLAMDSLFQFPKNEDPQVLQAFAKARDRQASAPAAPANGEASAPPAHPPHPLTATAPADPPVLGTVPAESAPLTSLALPAPDWTPGKNAPPHGNIGFALGAVPLGAGWLSRNKVKPGLTLGLLQAGGICLSLYASHLQTQEANDAYRVRDEDERAYIQTWQWVQIAALSTAVGAYLFSLIAATGD